MKNISISRFLTWVIYPSLIIGFTLFYFAGCSNGNKKEESIEAEGDKKREFVMVAVPVTLTNPEERAKYLVSHYWDNFDFSDTVYTSLPQVTEQAFANYIEILPHTDKETATASIRNVLSSAEKANTVMMYVYFSDLFKKYLYDPNSPLRNEELFIPVAEYIIADSKTDETDKERMKFDLEMMHKNRIGEQATDITYTLGSGKTGTLHDIKSNYTVLLFYNPDCHACAEILSYAKSSPVFNDRLENKSLSILAFYPDKDLTIWKKHLQDVPSTWINSYDKEQIVKNKKRYDLKAIPTLYLLDKDKKVILKDANIQEIEHYLSNTNDGVYIMK